MPIPSRTPAGDASIDPRRVRIIFAAVLCVTLWVLTETLSYLGLWIIEGHRFSVNDMRAKRAEVLDRTAYATARGGHGEILHPYLGYVLDPLHQGSVPVNELGFASASPSILTRSPERVIIGVFGGSVAQNFASQGAAALASGLAESPRFRGREIAIVPVGLGGWKQPQLLFAFEYLLTLGAEFDFVIEIDGFNEVALHAAENGRKHVFPAYPRNWFVRMTRWTDGQTRNLADTIQDAETARDDLAASAASGPFAWSPAANLFWRVRDAGLKWDAKRAAHALSAYDPGDAAAVATGPRRNYDSESALYEDLAAIWKRSSLQLARASRANGVEYFQFLQPNQYVAGSKPMGDEERRTAVRPDHPYRRGVEIGYPLLIRDGAELSRSGVRFENLTQIFADQSALLYTDDCCHFNQRGNEILAARIARAIIDDLDAR
jgi:hypothetical protein